LYTQTAPKKIHTKFFAHRNFAQNSFYTAETPCAKDIHLGFGCSINSQVMAALMLRADLDPNSRQAAYRHLRAATEQWKANAQCNLTRAAWGLEEQKWTLDRIRQPFAGGSAFGKIGPKRKRGKRS